MQAEKIHYDKLIRALNNKKLILFQYSSSSIKEENVKITSVMALDYFSDREWYKLGSEVMLHRDVANFIKKREGYCFAFWNYNMYYGFNKFDLRFSEEEIKKLDSRCIDLDAVFQYYGEIKSKPKGYVRIVRGGFDKRYYLALLNNLDFQKKYWIGGKHESHLNNYELLKSSSRAKIHVMGDLLTYMSTNKLKVEHNDKIIKKSKEIIGWWAWIKLQSKLHIELLKKLWYMVLGVIIFKLVEYSINLLLLIIAKIRV